MLIYFLQDQQNAPPFSRQNDSTPLLQSARGLTVTFAAAIADTATLVMPANPYRKGAKFFSNQATETVYLGHDSTVTTSNGYPVPTATAFEDTGSVDAWYAIMATGKTGDLRVIVYQ